VRRPAVNVERPLRGRPNWRRDACALHLWRRRGDVSARAGRVKLLPPGQPAACAAHSSLGVRCRLVLVPSRARPLTKPVDLLAARPERNPGAFPRRHRGQSLRQPAVQPVPGRLEPVVPASSHSPSSSTTSQPRGALDRRAAARRGDRGPACKVCRCLRLRRRRDQGNTSLDGKSGRASWPDLLHRHYRTSDQRNPLAPRRCREWLRQSATPANTAWWADRREAIREALACVACRLGGTGAEGAHGEQTRWAAIACRSPTSKRRQSAWRIEVALLTVHDAVAADGRQGCDRRSGCL